MQIITEDTLQSLRTRGYIGQGNNQLDDTFSSLKQLENYKVSSTTYLLLFNNLDKISIFNLFRYISLHWNSVCESLNDTCIIDNNPSQICEFFMSPEHQHRTYFFIEIVHQYFFP